MHVNVSILGVRQSMWSGPRPLSGARAGKAGPSRGHVGDPLRARHCAAQGSRVRRLLPCQGKGRLSSLSNPFPALDRSRWRLNFHPPVLAKVLPLTGPMTIGGKRKNAFKCLQRHQCQSQHNVPQCRGWKGAHQQLVQDRGAGPTHADGKPCK